VLVNNAGIVYRESLDRLREAEWGRVMAVNLKWHSLPARTTVSRAMMVKNVPNMVSNMMDRTFYCCNRMGSVEVPPRFSLTGN